MRKKAEVARLSIALSAFFTFYGVNVSVSVDRNADAPLRNVGHHEEKVNAKHVEIQQNVLRAAKGKPPRGIAKI